MQIRCQTGAPPSWAIKDRGNNPGESVSRIDHPENPVLRGSTWHGARSYNPLDVTNKLQLMSRIDSKPTPVSAIGRGHLFDQARISTREIADVIDNDVRGGPLVTNHSNASRLTRAVKGKKALDSDDDRKLSVSERRPQTRIGLITIPNNDYLHGRSPFAQFLN